MDLAVDRDGPAQRPEHDLPPGYAQRVRLAERTPLEIPSQHVDDGAQRDEWPGRRASPGQGRSVTADDNRPLLVGEDLRLRLVVSLRRRRRERQEPQGHGQQSGGTPEDTASESHYGNLTPPREALIPAQPAELQASRLC